jgi:hypothetical protein
MADMRPIAAVTELRAAVEDAEQLQRDINRQAHALAAILRGRLRHVYGDVLADLKRELADYNIHTHRWKERP